MALTHKQWVYQTFTAQAKNQRLKTGADYKREFAAWMNKIIKTYHRTG